MDQDFQFRLGVQLIRYLPLVWCPISGVWLSLGLWRLKMVDVKR